MKKSFAKPILIFLLSVLLLATLAAFASAEGDVTIVDNGTCGSNLTWTFDSAGTLTISGSGDMQNLSAWSSHRREIKSVSIGDSVTSIGDLAFSDCYSLTSVTIPDSVTSIGESAFSVCDSLMSVTIPDSVTSIGNWAFHHCTSLTSVTIPDSVTSIGEDAFSDCNSLTSVMIGNSVTSIGRSVFESCTSLTSMTIGNRVTSIGKMAFYNCTSLTSVTIPDSVTSIGEGAFADCSAMESVTIPASVTSIGNAAFFQTPLQQITILNPFCKIIIVYTDPETGETAELDYAAYTLGDEQTTIYGYPGSTAEAYAEKYERTFIALEPPAAQPMTETDTATGIAVTYDADAYPGEITLSVNKEESGGNYLVKTYEKTTAWDITTLLNGVETQPVEPVTVSIPVPDGYNENALAVYHVNDKGEAEKVEPITVKDGIITFTATAFSVYVVVDESSEVKPHTHTYTSAITTKPTCTTDGETTYTCSVCGDTYTEPIPATGNHVDTNNDGKCDTCGEKMTGGKHCKYCGKIHGGAFGWLVKFFHSIFAIFKR